MGPLLLAASEECTANIATCVADKVGDVVGATSKTLDFWSDPWGNTFLALQSSAHSLAATVIPALSKATMPNLTAEWFVNAYKVSFAAAVLLAVFLVLMLGARTASGSMSGRELGESLFGWFPIFLGGAAFGPVAGVWLVKFFAALSDSLIEWGIGGSADDVTQRMTAMLEAEDASGLAGGAVVGALLMVGMLFGLCLVLMVLVVQLVTLYLTGVLIPLGMAWIVDPRRRSWGARLLWVWLGVLASHPLLFFLLGTVWRMTSSQVGAFERVPMLGEVVQLLVTALALLMAACSPFILLKLAAPVMPTGAGGGARAAGMPGRERAYGDPSLSDAMRRYGQNPDRDTDQTGPSYRYDGPLSDGDESLPGPAAPAGRPGTAPTPGAGPTSVTGEGSLAARAGAGSASAGTSAGAGSAGGATSAAGASAAAGGGAAVGAGEGLIAVGAAESATGAGAVIGVPTLLAGAAAVEVKQAADATVQKVQELEELVTDMVADEAETYGREGLSSE